MKLVIASTVTQDCVRYSLDALNAMRNQACGKTVNHEGTLWVVSGAEVIPVAFVGDDADRNKTHILTVDLAPVADAENMVHTDCESCSRVSYLRPDQAELGGVPLDVCLRDGDFTRALVVLMNRQGIETDLSRVLRGTVEPED